MGNGAFRIPGVFGDLLPKQREIPGAPSLNLPNAFPAPTKFKSGNFVDRMPRVIRKLLGKSTVADQCMDYWIAHPASINGVDPIRNSPQSRCVMEVKQVKDWNQAKKFKTGVPSFVNFTNEIKEDLVSVVHFAVSQAPSFQIVINFPDVDIPDRPPKAPSQATRNDKAWSDIVEKWRVGLEPDGGTALDLANEMSYLLGNFNWGWHYVGVARRFQSSTAVASLDPKIYNSNLIQVRVAKVGIYALDSYDFVDRGTLEKLFGQHLGFFNVDDGDEGIEAIRIDPGAISRNADLVNDPGYYPPMGWCKLSNNVFNTYRRATGRGCDYLVYSTIEYLNFKEELYYDQITKEIRFEGFRERVDPAAFPPLPPLPLTS